MDYYGRMLRPIISILAVSFTATLYAQTQDSGPANAWTNATSGNWQDMHWSLGILPEPGQTVLLTNTGWKAIAINPATAANFPQTLNPASIYLGGYTDSFNLLLLNYAGFTVPLTVNSLVIGTNAGLTAFSSALSVNNGNGGAFSIGGTLNQADGASVSTANLNIGDIGPGAYNMTNGTLLVSGTQTVGGNFPSAFRQFGGTNYVQNVALLSGGEYDLYGGDLTTSKVIYRAGSGTFNQYGGVVRPDKMYVTMSTYVQAGGVFSCSDVELPGVTSQFDYADLAFFVQTGGTNNSGLSIGNYHPPFFNASAFGGYTLSNGVLNTPGTSIGPWGRFSQTGGSHTSGGIGLHGTETYINTASWATYTLSGGTLSTPAASLTIGSFVQTGGTNLISGDLKVNWSSYYNSSYSLSGGVLQTSNTTFAGTVTGGGGFSQSGGSHIVSNLLTISRSPESASWPYPNAYFVDFLLNGGQLIAPNIRIDSGACFHHRSGSLVNSRTVTLADGNWEAYTTQQPLGTLSLEQGTNAIYLPAGPAALRFANSGAVVWENSALLTIEGWNGSVSGGGAHQVLFGSNSTGLTSSQVAQVRFHNPNGANGYYPATLLNTGEIVPSRFLTSTRAGNHLEISWAPGMTLQSSTNVNGPYFDASGASSPYTPVANGPQRFFRLRQ
jgi:hypothetical protein